MAYVSVAVLENMAVDYNATRLYTGRLKFFVDDASHYTTIVNNLNGSGNLNPTYSSYSYSPDPQYDSWTYFVGSAMEASDFCRFSFLYENYFKNGVVGDRVWFYNADNPAFAFGFRYKAAHTTVYGTYYTFEPIIYIRNTTYYTGNTVTLYGIDSYGRKRDCVISAYVDPVNGYGYPLYNLSVARPDPEDKTGNSGTPHGWYPSDRTTFNEYRYYFYIMLMNVYTPPEPGTDPYEEGGISEVQTPDGSYDDTSDSITIPGAPQLNLSLNHFISAYAPNAQQLDDLADFLWGDYSGIDRHIAKFFADPTDAIISLHMLPFEPPSSTAIEVTIGRYGTSVQMDPLTAQFKDVDCGSISILPYWDNYLDYNPFTRLTLALPYVGEVQLDPDEVMGQTVSVLYRVDCLTGAFVCFVSIPDKILAQYTGTCALSVPISSANYAQANSAILNAATQAVGAAAGVAMGGGAAVLTDAGLGAASTALNVSNAKVNHSHSGALGGTAGFLGTQTPYIIIHRARQSVPQDANKYYGYPTNVTMSLDSVVGFTAIKYVILDDVPFTKEELDELRGILASGISI